MATVTIERPAARVLRVALPSPTLPPATTTNAWVLGEDDVYVVDPGSPWPEPQAALREALVGRRVKGVVLTHHHVDHMSGARALAEAAGAPILCHPLTAAALGWADTLPLVEGDRLEIGPDTWVAMHTPGHARGHLCFHDEARGVVVVGDMIAAEGTIILAPPDADLAAFLSGLRRLEGCGATLALPAHGPALPEAAAIFRQNRLHREARTAACRAALGSTPLSAEELVPAVYGPIPAEIVPLAAIQLCAHLEWLAQTGAAVERAGRWAQAAI